MNGTTEVSPTILEQNLRIGWVLVVVSSLCQLIRIFTATGIEGSTPFFCANDRSRWCTIAALVEENSYAIDNFYEKRDARNRRPWFTIDRVQHRSIDGRQHVFSSKPPLLPTIYAGAYWIVLQTTGLRLSEHPFEVGRAVLVIVNWLPWLLFTSLATRWWARRAPDCFAFCAGATTLLFGNFLFTFSNSLNNHVPAAMAVACSLVAANQLQQKSASISDEITPSRIGWGGLAGFAAAFAVSCELPALSWAGILAVLLLFRHGVRVVIGYLVGGGVIAVAFFGTNWLAHQQLRPAYGNRSHGAVICKVKAPPFEESKFDEGLRSGQIDRRFWPTVTAVRDALISNGLNPSEDLVYRASVRHAYLELWDEATQQRFAVMPLDSVRSSQSKSQEESSATREFQIAHWGDWYDYPGTYWSMDGPKGVDRGESSRLVYVFHTLVGHRGIFSLTPIWLLCFPGAAQIIRNGNSWQRQVLIAGVLVTLVCWAFYIARPLVDRNYGGVASGLRWMFWLVPIWWWLLTQSLLQTPRTFGFRCFVVGALVLSLVSSFYAWQNPWQHPWIFQWWEAWGWIHYR